MKRFLTYCILFIVPILAVTLPLEYALRQVPNPYRYKYEWMQDHAESVKTLVLGNSHTFYGIRPDLLDGGPAFSLANVAQDLNHDLSLLAYWEDRYDSLKTVILPISYFTWFSPGVINEEESYRLRYYMLYMDSDDYPALSFQSLEISDYRTALGKLKKLLHGEMDPGVDSFGWGNTLVLSQKDTARWNNGSEAKAAVLHHTPKDWSLIESNYAKMSRIAAFCADRHIRLVLVTTPCWSAYTEGLDPVQLEKMNELTARFTKEFHVPYLNYLSDPRFEADDFYDSNHLSDIGAAKFTRILNQDIF